VIVSSAAVTVLAGALAGVLMWQRPKTIRTQAVLMVIAGMGAAGLLGEWLNKAATWAANLGSSASAHIAGAAVPAVAAVVLVSVWLLQMDKRGKPPTRATVWMGLFIAAAFTLIPGQIGAQLNHAVVSFNHSSASVVASMFGG